jgi:ribosomal-protein-alanine N-acetyltransferase
MAVAKAGGTPASPLRIRLATTADIPAVIAIEQHATTAAHWSSELYRAAFSGQSSRVALIAEREGGVVGFIIGRVLHDEWEIENIVVAESVRRRGLGIRLLGEFLELARDRSAKAIFLEVRESNLAARSLYEEHAFVGAGRRKQYYRDPSEDAILYRLEIV